MLQFLSLSSENKSDNTTVCASLLALLLTWGLSSLLCFLTILSADGYKNSLSCKCSVHCLWPFPGSLVGVDESLAILLEGQYNRADALSTHPDSNLTVRHPRSASNLTSWSDLQTTAPIRRQVTVSASGWHDSSSSGCPSMSSSTSRLFPRMHLSSCRSDWTTWSCSLTDCSHCCRRREI